ncbi:TRM11 family SAM-dependent methyltransferase [Xylanibacillus composti]|uniref:Methyltransferase n=1 Tax=Xylanibacillus composti TaxID=1572762 RepID=A0A8J4M0R6_9BACL|nr:RsmD family RNA methyltransferase [Xylanibacillus composti]GIQ68070.1 methyltransferase [Xylanibacillus composti]
MSTYLYTYARHEDERDFCSLKLRTLFRSDYIESDNGQAFVSKRGIDPGRSPFLKEQLQIVCADSDLDELARQVGACRIETASFKVQYMKTGQDVPYAERRDAERVVGWQVRGTAEMKNPDRVFGLARWESRWLFGPYRAGEAAWLRHADKPQQYSTALSVRTARALVNMAAPDARIRRLVDPCCGIGTVLLEALSLGMDIRGFDRNWMAVHGARRNLAHFGYPDVVQVADIRGLVGEYDAVILDLPYNLLSKQSEQELAQMLKAARRLAPRAVIVSIGRIEEALDEAGWHTLDQSVWKKSSFVRHIWVCERFRHDEPGAAGT